LFAAAESTTLNLEMRRQTAQATITEIPLLLALYYLSPLSVILIRFIAIVGKHAIRRLPFEKAAFNVASSMLGVVLATLVVEASRPLEAVNVRTWLALLGAVLVADLVTVIGVFIVISLVQGGIAIRDLMPTAVSAVVVGVVNSLVGLLVLVVIQASPWGTFLVAALACAIVGIYRAYAKFRMQHKSLNELYNLTRAIADHPYENTLADVLLHRVRELLRAEYATLWLPAQGRYPESLLSSRADDRGLLDRSPTPTDLRGLAIDAGKTVVATPKSNDEAIRESLRSAGTKDAIIAPLRSGGTVIGTLEVSNRLHSVLSFSDDDVRLLDTLAAQTSVTVENTRLIDRLRFDANHDSLTQLPNRRRMLAALSEAVRIKAEGEVVAVLVFDVDGLRDVNESLGHTAGDKVLVEFATRLRQQSPPAALVGRIGGDKFAVTMRMPDSDAALAFGASLRQSLQVPMEIGSLRVDIDSAAGVSVHPDHGSDPEKLLQQADVATQTAKGQSPALQLFDPSLESMSVRRLGLASDLRRALEHGDLDLFYQPKVLLHNRQLVGVECLARWEHPVHGPVPPEDFVAVAEHTGQLGRLNDFVLREAFRRGRDWVRVGRPMPISVNVSPKSLVDHDFPDQVATLLDEYGIDPDLLTLEIKEDSPAGDTDRQLPVLRRLDAIGVRLAVDDFGTGYSSLAYLRRLPVDEVKIDRSFVQGMATDPGELAIVRAVVDLARHFELRVVAEGVESERTLSLLADMGCDIGQGFLFSRPLPYDRLEAWLAAQTDTERTSKGEVRRLRAAS
jgi:diguanylate cyclase (GGDEF)-like protein